MRLYHTSNVIVSKPDVIHSRKHLDFGTKIMGTGF